jgi:hypothetical protein
MADALRLYSDLLPDQVRVLGPDHVDTLLTRASIAVLTGQYGDTGEALRLSTRLLPDLERIFGPDHAVTLAIRSHIEGLS